MEIKLLEHVNIRTTQLKTMEAWYIEVLELEKGYRPPFGVNGSWLYGAGYPMVHLVEVSKSYDSSENSQMEHFAMRASGLESLLTRLKAKNIAYSTVRVPELQVLQVFFSDPEGNNMHIDFPPEEADALGL